jgi:hypothetical protein
VQLAAIIGIVESGVAPAVATIILWGVHPDSISFIVSMARYVYGDTFLNSGMVVFGIVQQHGFTLVENCMF